MRNHQVFMNGQHQKFLIDARGACRYGCAMTTTPDTALVRELRARISELEHQNTDLKRQVTELRAAVCALMEPDMPRILRNPGGIMLLDAH